MPLHGLRTDSVFSALRVQCGMVHYILSLSGGKDSSAALLYAIKNGLPLHEAVYYDNGMDFACVRSVVYDQLAPIMRENRVKLTVLRPKTDFVWDMLERPIRARNGSIKVGRKWCGGPCRWGTRDKLDAIGAYCRELCRDGDSVHQYVGIAADEEPRLLRLGEGKSSPIADAGMVESDCLSYCRERGISWNENGYDLYDNLDRLSCWCCRNKNLKEMRFIYRYLPEYWERLRWMQTQMPGMPFKRYGSIFDLEKRFDAEERNGQAV